MNRPLLHSLVITLVLSLLITGCWDRRELEDRELAVAMAIDRKKEGLQVSIQVPIATNIAGGATSGAGGAFQVYSQEGRTLSDALSKMNEKLDKSLFLGYLGMILFGEEQSHAGIQEVLDMIRRDPNLQRRLYPVVTKGKSKPFLESGTEMEEIKSIFIRNMLEAGEQSEVTIPFRLHDLLVSLSSPTREAPILNYIGLEEGKFRWLGLAVFQKDRMIGTLSPDETVPLLQLREERVGQKVLVPCPEKDGVFQFHPMNVKRKIRVSEGPSLHIHVEVEGKLTEKTCREKEKKNEQNQMLEQQIQRYYEQQAKRLITKAQKEWKLDIFEFGRYVHAYHYPIYQSINWRQQFDQIPIDVVYRVYLRREGTSLN